MSSIMIRSFISVDLESSILDKILVFQRHLVDTGAHLKIVDSKNIHITLKFLANNPPSLVNRIGEELQSIQFEPFEVTVQGTGVFPNRRYIKVVWVGIEKGVADLINIHKQIESKLTAFGLSSTSQDFRPHITIARTKSAKNKNKLAEAIFNIQDKEFGTFNVSSIKLKRSNLTPKGPIYETLAEISAKKSFS